VRILTTIIRNGNIPHALLFTGIEGVGKQTTAMAFAMALNCTAQIRSAERGMQNQEKVQIPTESCCSCRSCKKIQTGNHPDIIHLKPSGAFIRVDQIRGLCRTLSLKPFEARRRVVLISDSHAMNPAAGNALLKILEEPPGRTILILTTLQISDLLPTIVSRCQHIRFNPISRSALKKFLIEKQGLHPDNASTLATLAHGSFSRALSLSRTNWISRRKWLIHASGLDQPESLSLRSVGSLLAFAERLSKNKETLFDALEIMKTWLRDLVVWKYHPEKIINKDFIDSIQNISQKSTAASLLLKIAAIQEAQKDIQANSNLRLTLDVLMMRMARV